MLPLIDEQSGVLIGEVCHIKGCKPTRKGDPVRSKRYDPKQTDAERHGFYNLILLCRIHHTVIDADDIAYTVDRLKTMKADHQAKASKKEALSDAAARTLIQNISQHVIGGSIISPHNMSGGQAAHSITNITNNGPRFGKLDFSFDDRFDRLLEQPYRAWIKVLNCSEISTEVQFSGGCTLAGTRHRRFPEGKKLETHGIWEPCPSASFKRFRVESEFAATVKTNREIANGKKRLYAYGRAISKDFGPKSFCAYFNPNAIPGEHPWITCDCVVCRPAASTSRP